MKGALLSTILVGLCFCSAASQTVSTTPTAASSPPEKIATKTNGTTPTPATPSTAVDVKTGKAALVLPPEKANPVKIALFAKPPTIDGKLDDEIWKTASVLKDFYEIQPGDNLIPPHRTEVMLGYDPKFL